MFEEVYLFIILCFIWVLCLLSIKFPFLSFVSMFICLGLIATNTGSYIGNEFITNLIYGTTFISIIASILNGIDILR